MWQVIQIGQARNARYYGLPCLKADIVRGPLRFDTSSRIGQLPNSLILNALGFAVMRMTFDEASDK